MKHFESFESNRWIWRANILLQVVLVLALVVVVNFIGMTVWQRFDLTRNGTSSLSGEALSYVRDLDRRAPADPPGRHPVEVVVTLTDSSDDETLEQAYRDVHAILRKFEYAARDNERTPIQVEYLNVYRDRTRAEALGLADNPNVVVFKYLGRPPRFLTLSDLYITANRERREFVGERAIASALLEITSQRRPILYFLTGHGEMQLDDVQPGRGASSLDTQFRARAYETVELDLAESRGVPDDPDNQNVVLILGPQTGLLRSEQEMLRDYLTKRAGRVILALDPGRKHGLDDLLFEWGILADDVIVVERDPRSRTETGDLRIPRVAADHPITRALSENRIPVVFGAARSVRPDPGRPIDEALVTTPLLVTSNTIMNNNEPSSFGETAIRETPSYDPGRDLAGPLVVATASERRVDPNLRVNVQGGRFVIFGSSDFLANRRLAEAGNLTLILNAVTWALDPERHVDIPARPIERLKLTLSEQQLFVSGLLIILGPSLAVTLLGLAVYLSRRR